MTDYDAARTTAALFDTSDAAKLVLTGPDAPLFLSNLSTNDIKKLPLGGSCEAYFCDARGKVQFQAWIDHVRLAGAPAMWVETTPGRNAALAKYLDRYLISERVEIADRTADFAQFHMAGPEAPSILEKAGVHAEDSASWLHIRGRNPLGVAGFDIVCNRERGEDLRAALIAAGAAAAAPATFETLRIEAGTPLFGPDIDENRFVMEVGDAARAVSFTKGCFLGQEPIVMARDRAGRANRAFVSMKVLDGGPLPAGTKLSHENREIGLVTSSCHSPRLNAALALGYVHWKCQAPGTLLHAADQTVAVLAGI